MADGKQSKYRVLKYFPFTSERKASSIVVRDHEDRLFAFVKGADSSMKKFLKADSDQSFIDEEVESFAAQGLRTLVFGFREIEAKDLATFEGNHKLRQAETAWDWDQLKAEDVECDLEPLAVTAVEDLLQERVRECIVDFKDAGINVWMLTGDKGLTAKMISI